MKYLGMAVCCAFSSALLTANVHAGRPLTVDDANTNETGHGHVELWFAAEEDGKRQWNVAPAFAPVDNVELSAVVSRSTEPRQTNYAIQAKWVLLPSQRDGCNPAVTGGVSRNSATSGTTPYGNVIVTCNTELGTFHLNAGAYRERGSSAVATWGMAAEREFAQVTAHVELFGERGSKPTVQLGARTALMPRIQIDGTIGLRARTALYSVGVKLQL